MAELTHRQYDMLEHAIVQGRRLSVYRRGTEYVVVPTGLAIRDGREALDTIHPTTGAQLTLYIDEIDGIEMVG